MCAKEICLSNKVSINNYYLRKNFFLFPFFKYFFFFLFRKMHFPRHDESFFYKYLIYAKSKTVLIIIQGILIGNNIIDGRKNLHDFFGKYFNINIIIIIFYFLYCYLYILFLIEIKKKCWCERYKYIILEYYIILLYYY